MAAVVPERAPGDADDPGDATGSARRFWLIASSAILLVVAGAFAFFHFGIGPRQERPAPRPVGPNAKPYREPAHMDASASRLETPAPGTPSNVVVLVVVVRDVADGEDLVFVRRDGGPDPRHAWVYLDRRPAGALPARLAVGALSATTEPTGVAGERRARVTLEGPLDRVTVVDLRWEKGKWQGFEIATSAPAASLSPPR